MELTLHVVIAACGQPQLLRRTLASLADCAKPTCYRGVIVAENGPACGLDRIVAEFGPQHRFTWFYSQPANKSLALNRALELVADSLVVFTDDDVVVGKETLLAYARGTAAARCREFYGGPIVPDYEGEPPPAWLVPLLPRSAGGWRMAANEKAEINQPEFIGPNFAAFAADILRAGGFDERLGPGAHLASPGEDTEIQSRLLAGRVRGFYLPDAGIAHRVRTSACTVEFAVHRAERNGIYWGIAQARACDYFPRRALKIRGQWINDLLRIARGRRSGDLARRVRADCLAARWRGRWKGIRLGRDWTFAADSRRAA